jgi:hypothetical protein
MQIAPYRRDVVIGGRLSIDRTAVTATDGLKMPVVETTPADDLLDGAEDFVRFTGFNRRRVYHLIEHGWLPAGKLGGKLIGSKRAVREALAKVSSGQAA